MKKTIACMTGLAIGDALGQPFEFKDVSDLHLTSWDGTFIDGAVWNLSPGQWTDDTKMALAIAESLLEQKGFNGDRVALNYIDWVKTGDLRGIGLTCERAIMRLCQGVSIEDSGRMQPHEKPKLSFKIKREGQAVVSNLLTGSGDYCGNGTVMRCAPIGLYFKDDIVKLVGAASIDATMTHDHPDARDASVLLCTYIGWLAQGKNKFDALRDIILLAPELFGGEHVLPHAMSAVNALREDLSILDASGKLGARGTAHETLASAIYCFLKYPTFKEAVIASILIGGDTDTRAAIVGALAGTAYGLEGIPEEYVKGVEDSDMLQSLDEELSK